MDLSSKALRDLDLDEIVYAHLTTSLFTETNDHVLRSCLHEVEDEMRQSRGLAITANYAPAMCAFALLDQIGTTYSDSARVAYPDANASGIKKSLYYWAGLTPNGPETKALYAFRNGIDHDGSLTSNTNSGDWYFFRYRKNLGVPIKLAVTDWDGSAATIGPQATTLVDVRELTELTSQALSAARDCFAARRSDLDVLKSKEDILHKYIFWDRN